MKLRGLVLLLLLLNGVWYVWAQGWLLVYGFGPTPQREPGRLAQQIRPEAIRIVPAHDVARVQAATAAVDAVMCMQSGPLDETRADAIRRVLQTALPAQAWVLEASDLPERWIIYMGKFANAAEQAKKRAQLANLRLTFEPLSNSALAPGLSLGAFESQVQADNALVVLTQRGVRTARVVQEQPARPGVRLRLPAMDEAQQKQLPAIRSALAGQALVPCDGVAEPR